ncbi:major capsid protein [Sigmofec virus UA08Rod_6752]|uniref:Major capsid protein n=1 Tax=Sigmofec virus UA08Rod_6752 TaxID=2929239 RepID=A0A976N0S5_9VIRU|nr:major capsid protein [Sigmofec virus UA08Rod_6752]
MKGNRVSFPRPPCNWFGDKFKRLYTGNMGVLIPFFCEYAMPNSTWKISVAQKIRLNAMITPAMHTIKAYAHFFQVPLRLLMNEKDYENYMTGGKDGTDDTPTPTVNSGPDGYAAGSLMDYLGYAANYYNDNLEEVKVANFTQNAWALRAYNKVVNDWYKNLNVSSERNLSLEPGLDTTTDRSLAYRCWMPDKYTDALPDTQRGPQISIPLETVAPVKTSINPVGEYPAGLRWQKVTENEPVATGRAIHTAATTAPDGYNSTVTVAPGVVSDMSGNIAPANLWADLTDAGSIGINELMDSIALNYAGQLSMRAGTRLVEYLYAFFGVRSSDARLQRSQYIGGFSSPVYIDEVEQNSATSESTTPQGNLAGKGITINVGTKIKCFCEEPTVVIGIASVMPETSYFQGSRKWMNYMSRLDYPNPVYANLGYQPILEKELFAQGDDVTSKVGDVTVTNESNFGFEPRFQEQRSFPSTQHGEFRTTRKYWTLVREFSEPPLLNQSFVEAGQVSKRIFAVTDQTSDSLLCETFITVAHKSPLPKYSNPSSMGLLYYGR